MGSLQELVEGLDRIRKRLYMSRVNSWFMVDDAEDIADAEARVAILWLRKP
jgi:hypothetical protein